MKLRFAVGAIPENQEFQPDVDGWRALREPSPLLAQLIALLPLAVIMAGLVALWRAVVPAWTWSRTLDQAVLLGLPVFFVLTPIHECIHLLAHPGRGGSPLSLLGVWPQKGIVYAHYDGELSRERFLAILLAPFVVLSLGAVVAATVIGRWYPFWMAVSLTNTLGACVDVLGALFIAVQVPRMARVRNKGWRTYWRRRAADACEEAA